ncbi:hypothetical protein [Streptomyces sp. 5-10]|uniref:hypothetical protein n=1 Tax=Streptomyces sp. 5-10 TaxID=878925 RepID=UPI00168B86BE|nr:hypothetical protein [Streptomyces sp. 5-10]MBD3004766.1 hypothetical protein [Streptomyces sp. 5-10]
MTEEAGRASAVQRAWDGVLDARCTATRHEALKVYSQILLRSAASRVQSEVVVQTRSESSGKRLAMDKLMEIADVVGPS